VSSGDGISPGERASTREVARATTASESLSLADRWVETPKFLLRRDCLDYTTRAWPSGRFLEIGAGTGRLTSSLLERGFIGKCFDLGAASRDHLRRSLSRFGTSIDVVDTLEGEAPASFDYVLAFEVLEHIQGDVEALRSWVRYLRPGGRILISVPAHMRKFSEEDRAVGVLSYGFPIAILTRRGSQLLSHFRKNRGGESELSPEALSIRSGIERSDASVRMAWLLNRHTMAPFMALQRLFFKTDLGDGYVAHAVRVDPAVAGYRTQNG
jgi:SAM-dependent methyltransferase